MISSLYQYGQEVTVVFHEAECGEMRGIITEISLDRHTGKPLYTVNDLDEYGNMLGGGIDSIDEEMIHA